MAQKYGYKANDEIQEIKPCLVCDDSEPRFSWTDKYGEGYCLKCGTPYQMVGGKIPEGETYPCCKIKKESLTLFRAYYQETKKPNGMGSFMIWRDYPDQLEGRKAFNEWAKENEHRFIEK
jgi:hypothetical protein